MEPKDPKKHSLKDNLPVLKCTCGYEILLLPDLNALGNAIQKHVLADQMKYGLTQKEADAREDYLVAQVFSLVLE